MKRIKPVTLYSLVLGAIISECGDLVRIKYTCISSTYPLSPGAGKLTHIQQMLVLPQFFKNSSLLSQRSSHGFKKQNKRKTLNGNTDNTSSKNLK